MPSARPATPAPRRNSRSAALGPRVYPVSLHPVVRVPDAEHTHVPPATAQHAPPGARAGARLTRSRLRTREPGPGPGPLRSPTDRRHVKRIRRVGTGPRGGRRAVVERREGLRQQRVPLAAAAD
ncbi:hypothetical protein DL767_003982 [Monosporascus sp. MG133]|nr:hypothetical protein DL767_003982 [Monosporascus sp. MG133]